MTEQIDIKQRNRGRRTLIFIVLLFSIPVIGAQLLYWFGDGHQGNVNRGELYNPGRPWSDLDLQRLDEAGRLTLKQMEKLWTLVYVDSSQCDQRCETNLYNIRQTRLALGGEKERIQRLMVLTDTQQMQQFSSILAKHEGMMLATGSASELSALNQLLSVDGQDRLESQKIYLFDPFGNVIMHYAADVNPKDIIKDLERLLKINRI